MHDTARRSATAAFLVTLVTGAHAASFDCKAAKTPTEKAICGSPKLSALDERLARDYERALQSLSAAGAASLKQSQRGWLRYATQVCVPGKRPGHGESTAECLEIEFGRRVDQLAQAGIRVGPYVFNRVDYYAAARAHDDEGGAHSGFVTDHVAFAQIDAPVTPATTAWNAAQRKEDPGPISVGSAPDDVAEDDDTDYTLGCAGDRFVSLQVNGSEYQHGTAHGTYDHEVRNLLLAPALRKMTASDLFAAGAPWKSRLPTLFWNVYATDPDAAKDVESVQQAIKESAADPQAWLLTPEGLQISFDAYQAGCYACNPGPITVPWAALRPMLATPEFAACKAPPAPKR
jgi:uncharacterized protein YecT (DUF1311 family)